MASLPPEFREAVDNVSVVIEERPGREDHAGREDRGGEPLLGIYRGIPLVERAGYSMVVPDVIAIFRRPLLRACRRRRDLRREVELTVLHELGHFLGLPEAAVEHL